MRALKMAIWMLCLAGAPVAFAQSSTNFRMDRVTVASTAESASSSNYSIAVTFAQEGPVGSISRCNDSFLQSTGFWSILGESPVPLQLLVGRDGTDRTLPALFWSGSSSEFTVYRATMPQGVVDPLNQTLVTDSCATVDNPPFASVVFYVVEATGN